MAAKFTRLTHKIAIQLRIVADSCSICSSHSRRPVRKLLYTLSYTERRILVLAKFREVVDYVLVLFLALFK
jgi:hypothetical protein